jgi:hypothetical protein
MIRADKVAWKRPYACWFSMSPHWHNKTASALPNSAPDLLIVLPLPKDVSYVRGYKAYGIIPNLTTCNVHSYSP